MDIEEGKFYRNRRGGITGPMRPVDLDDGYSWAGIIDGASILFTDYGRYSAYATSHPLDLVSEYRPGVDGPTPGV